MEDVRETGTPVTRNEIKTHIEFTRNLECFLLNEDENEIVYAFIVKKS